MFAADTRFLIVDDMMAMRRLMIRALKELGYSDFLEAADGAQAWEALISSKISVGVILADWIMPNSNGLDLLKRIRSSERFQDLPFILVTVESNAEQVAKAKKAGVTGYIVKPFDLEAIKANLATAYKKAAG